jgi:hypothetical protein
MEYATKFSKSLGLPKWQNNSSEQMARQVEMSDRELGPKEQGQNQGNQDEGDGARETHCVGGA